MTGHEVLFVTKRLTVTRMDAGDIDILLPVLSNPLTMTTYGDGLPMDRDRISALIASYPRNDPNLLSQPGIAWLSGTDTVIGFGGVGYYRAPGNTADVLVIIDVAFQRNGYGTELVRAAILDAFASRGITTVHATARPDNAPSIRLLERAGMTHIGRSAQHDRLLYRIDRQDSR